MKKKYIIKPLYKKIILIIFSAWIVVSIFLSIKVSIWHSVSYKQHGKNNPYFNIMTDEDFYGLSSERDKSSEVDNEKNIFIPLTIWYGGKAKVLCYVYYRSYCDNGELYNGTDGFFSIRLYFDDFKWKVENVESMVP